MALVAGSFVGRYGYEGRPYTLLLFFSTLAKCVTCDGPILRNRPIPIAATIFLPNLSSNYRYRFVCPYDAFSKT
jgi:hypothetical protein